MKNVTRFDHALQWSATLLTILGALFTAFNMYPENVWAFNVGSALWLWFAIRVRVHSLIVVNGTLLLIYAAGIVHSLV
jgi:hypothetical protein